MDNSSDNIIYIKFYDKCNFPPGIWKNEPDFCCWKLYNLTCLVFRDMSFGVWKGFVGVSINHSFYKKDFYDLLNQGLISDLEIHGGLATIGKLPQQYDFYNKNTWWIGFECTQGDDYFPLFNDNEKFQTYKNFSFIRKETNHLARFLISK